jgi:hypothetical protein
MKTQNKFKVSGAGWLCIEVNGKWVPSCKLTDSQIKDIKDTLTPTHNPSPSYIPAYYESEGGSMCNGLGRSFV